MPHITHALKLAVVGTILLGQLACSGSKQIINTQASAQAPSIKTSSQTNGKKTTAALSIFVHRVAIAFGNVGATQNAYKIQISKASDKSTVVSNSEIAILLGNLKTAYQAELKTAAYRHKLVISNTSAQVPLLSIKYDNFSKTCDKAGNCLYALDINYTLQHANGKKLWEGKNQLRNIAQLRNRQLYKTLGQFGVNALLDELRKDGFIN